MLVATGFLCSYAVQDPRVVVTVFTKVNTCASYSLVNLFQVELYDINVWDTSIHKLTKSTLFVK